MLREFWQGNRLSAIDGVKAEGHVRAAHTSRGRVQMDLVLDEMSLVS
jgi:hypothetical protein